MEDVGKEGRTIIFVSHNSAAVSLLCNKGLLLHKGALMTFSHVSETLDQYLQIHLPPTTLKRDLSEKKRNSNLGSKVCIQFIEIVTNVDHEIRSNQSLKVKIFLEVNERQFNLIVGIGISTTMDVRLITVESPVNLVEKIKPGIFSVEVEIPNPGLPEGTYILSAGVRNAHNFLSLDYVQDALLFNVHPQTQDIHYESNSSLGLRPLSNWHILEAIKCGCNE
jgi:lipopolysaccharide transport system ATP-binding protein